MKTEIQFLKKRKTRLLADVLLASSFLFQSPVSAQEESPSPDGKDEWRQAVYVLKGMDTSRTKEWAVEFLESTLAEEKDAFVLNVLSVAYLHGLGTEPDTLKAISYMEQSGENGYAPAYHNLGAYYKLAPRDRQDFKKAYEAFCKGAEAGFPSCQYDKGFMLYKGLGCEQNYAAAVEEFQKAADDEHRSALFMLGLCYRNGYGVDVDEERAKILFERGAKLGSKDAMEELLNSKPENDPDRKSKFISRDMAVPDNMPEIEPYVPDNKNNLAGHYNGMLVTYDWSGEYVISERKISLDMAVNEDKATGLWLMDNDTIPFTARVSKNGELVFDSVEVSMYDRYSRTYSARYCFDKVDISYISDMISGRLRLYSLDEQEPERPMYVCLQKSGAFDGDDMAKDDNSRIYSYPNPFVSQVTLHFELDNDVKSAKICVYSRTGILRQSYSLGALSAGACSYTIMPDLSEDVYVVHVVADGHVYETVIFRKK